MSAKMEAFTETYADARYKLGTERTEWDETYGFRTFVFVQNGHATDPTAVGMPVITEGGAQNYFVGTPGTANAKRISVLGAAVSIIAAAYYGWLLKKGRGLLLGDGAVAAGDIIYTGTATFSATAGTGEPLGVAEANDAPTFAGYIDV